MKIIERNEFALKFLMKKESMDDCFVRFHLWKINIRPFSYQKAFWSVHSYESL
jgi:hypothetical protein